MFSFFVLYGTHRLGSLRQSQRSWEVNFKVGVEDFVEENN